MTTFYLLCAVVGSAVLVVQFVLSLVGQDSGDLDAGGADLAADADLSGDGSSAFFGLLSFQSIVAAIAFLGIGGMALHTGGMGPALTLMGAVLCGFAAMVVVAWTMRFLYSLKSEGNVRIENALGLSATVYLTVPPANSGRGKVTVSLQSRTVEYDAVTSKDTALPQGAAVTIIGVVGSDTVEVEPVAHT